MSLWTFLKDRQESMSKIRNRDYEFSAELEDHPIGDQNIYRLYYINYHRIGERYGLGPDNIGMINIPFKPFMLPENMSREDAFKVLSYLTDYIEKTYDIEEGSYKSVSALNKLIDIDSLGFRRVDIDLDDKSDDVINLFTVSGRLLLFKNSEFYNKYFEWYSEGITLDEVRDIYSKCGVEFTNIEKNQVLINNIRVILRKI